MFEQQLYFKLYFKLILNYGLTKSHLSIFEFLKLKQRNLYKLFNIKLIYLFFLFLQPILYDLIQCKITDLI